MPKITIYKERCKGCGLCIHFCPQHCLRMAPAVNKKGNPFVEIADEEACKGCSLCVVVCPDGCIVIKK